MARHRAFDSSALVAELRQRLPRLLFAAVDRFPLAGGVAESGGSVSVLAVRAEPVPERLDACTADQLRCLVRGSAPSQADERLLVLRLPLREEEGVVGQEERVRVCWHDAADFSSLLLKGNPSCVEALASEEPPLFAAEEWGALREAFGRDSCRALLAGKSYRNACAGPVLRLAKPSGRSHKRQPSPAAEAPEEEELAGRLDSAGLQAAAALLRRAAGGDEALAARVEALAAAEDDRKSAWLSLAQDVMQATKGVPHATAELPRDAVHVWVDGVRRADFLAFASRCGADAAPLPPCRLSFDQLLPEGGERLAAEWPEGAELAFMAQSGSFMYDLQVPSSDCDYSIIFLAAPEALAGRAPPSAEFHGAAEAAFASDKRGEVEYSGKELGSFLLELAKGNPRNIELLFTEKRHLASPVWQELRAKRQGFITLRCAKQYLGFVGDRLGRASKELEACAPEEELGTGVAKRFSKWLYHAYHKVFELARILDGGPPAVALTGAERDLVLGLRLRPPGSRAEAAACLAEAEARLRELSARLEALEATAALPAEVDAEALLAWLGSVRARQAAAAAPLGPLCEAAPP